MKYLIERRCFFDDIHSNFRRCWHAQVAMGCGARDQFIDSAAAANIHVFPRNGLLLGVVRHRGFMPSEDPPDIDLGIMYSDLGTILDLPDFGFESIRGDGRYQLVVDTTLPSWNLARRN